MSFLERFINTNNAILRKIIVIAGNRSARFRVSSALGALGRRFESCRPDSNNPSYRIVSQPVFFNGWNMTYWYLCHIYVICPSLLSYSQIFLVLQYIFSRINIFKDRLIIFTVRLCKGFGAAFPLFFCLLLIYGEI